MPDGLDSQLSDPLYLELVPLVASAHDGTAVAVDRATFEDWYEQSVDDVFGFLARRVGADHAEDLTADVYIRAWKRRDSYRPERGVPRAWLFGIANNLLKDHRRRERRQLRAYGRLAGAVASGSTDPLVEQTPAKVDMELLQPVIAQALLAMSDDDRDILWLHATGELSYREIAEVLDLAVGTVRSRLSRARGRLASVLSADPHLATGAS